MTLEQPALGGPGVDQESRNVTQADPARRRCTEPRAIPMTGVDSGAMIIAPTTVAVRIREHPARRDGRGQRQRGPKGRTFQRGVPDDRSRSSAGSSSERRWAGGRTRARTLLSTAPNQPGTPGPPKRDVDPRTRRFTRRAYGAVEHGDQKGAVRHRRAGTRTYEPRVMVLRIGLSGPARAARLPAGDALVGARMRRGECDRTRHDRQHCSGRGGAGRDRSRRPGRRRCDGGPAVPGASGRRGGRSAAG